MRKVPNEKVLLLLKPMKKVVFNVSELYYNPEQQYWCWCIKPQFMAVQTQVRWCRAFRINGFRTVILFRVGEG